MRTCARYIRDHLAELVLFMVMSVALSATMCECFFVDMTTMGSVFLTIVPPIVLGVALYAAVSSRKAMAIGIPVIVVLVIVTYVVLGSVTPTRLFVDSYDNSVFAFHVSLVTTLVLFCLSRRRTPLIAAFVIGAVLCSAVQFLYGKNHILEAALFIIACASLIMMKGHGAQKEITNVSGVKKLGAPLAALAVSALAFALAAGAFFAIIAPLHPPARELKLITEYYALEEVHVSGLTDIIHMMNENLDSKNVEDDQSKSSELGDQSENAQGKSAPSPNGVLENLGSGMMNALGELAMSVINYLAKNWLFVLIVVLLAVALLLAAIIALRRWQRRRKLERLTEQGAYAETVGIYRYVCNGYEAGGVCQRGHMTPAELAENVRIDTDRFEQGTMPLDFATLTDTFSRAAYGDTPPSEVQREQLREYYRAFPAHMLRFAGKLKYLRLFFKV